MRSERRRNRGFTWGKLYWAIIAFLVIAILISLLMLWGLFAREAKDLDNTGASTEESASTVDGESIEGETSGHPQQEDEIVVDDSEKHYRRSATASSELPEEGGVTYVARNVYDGDFSTAWTENGYGTGEGEWIEVSFDKRIPGALTIYNGYQKSEDLYYQNARIMDVEIEFLNGQKYRVTLSDVMGPQTIVFPNLEKTNGFRLTILSAYEGYRWEDNNITEIEMADIEEVSKDEDEIDYDDEDAPNFGEIINAELVS